MRPTHKFLVSIMALKLFVVTDKAFRHMEIKPSITRAIPGSITAIKPLAQTARPFRLMEIRLSITRAILGSTTAIKRLVLMELCASTLETKLFAIRI